MLLRFPETCIAVRIVNTYHISEQSKLTNIHLFGLQFIEVTFWKEIIEIYLNTSLVLNRIHQIYIYVQIFIQDQIEDKEKVYYIGNVDNHYIIKWRDN